MLISYFERVVHNKPVGQIREDPSTGQLWEDTTSGMSVIDISEWASSRDLASSLGLDAEGEGMSPTNPRDGSPSNHEGDQDLCHQEEEGGKSSGSPGPSSPTMNEGQNGDGSQAGGSEDTHSARDVNGTGASMEGSPSGKQSMDRDRPSNGTESDDGATTTGGSTSAPSPRMLTEPQQSYPSYPIPQYHPYQSAPPSRPVQVWYDPTTRYDPFSSGGMTTYYPTSTRYAARPSYQARMTRSHPYAAMPRSQMPGTQPSPGVDPIGATTFGRRSWCPPMTSPQVGDQCIDEIKSGGA